MTLSLADRIPRELSPTAEGVGTPLSELVDEAALRRVPAAVLTGTLDARRWAVHHLLDGVVDGCGRAMADASARRGRTATIHPPD